VFLTACIDCKDIPLGHQGTPSSDALRVLEAFAIATRRPAESSLDVHQLVHLAVRDWLREQGVLREWTYKAVVRLVQVFPDSECWARSKWGRLLSHIKAALSHGPSDERDKAKINLAWKYAKALGDNGRSFEAEELFKQILEIRKRMLGEDHPDTLTRMASMANLAATYRD